MPVYPSLKTDIVRYEPTDVYADQNIKITLLDGSTLEIWGTAFYNGNPLTTIGALPIATQAEAEAGVDNTKVMTPLRVNQAVTAKGAYTKAEADAKFVDAAGDIMTGPLDVLRVIIGQAPGALNHATRKDYVDAGDTAAKAYADSIVAGINVGTLNIYTKPEADAKFIDAAGDTFTGNIFLAADPSSPLHAATKQYVDGKVAAVTVGSLNVYTKAEADTKFVDTAGDSMTGPLVVPTLTVNGLSVMRDINIGVGQGSVTVDKVVVRNAPSAPSDGTNKTYVDTQVTNLQTYTDAQITSRSNYTYVNTVPPPMANYLTATVGTVTTPNPGVLPAQFTFIYKVRSSPSNVVENTIASQWTAQLSWIIMDAGSSYKVCLFDPGAGVRSVGSTAFTGNDEYRAVSVNTNNGTNCALASYVSADGVTWTLTHSYAAGAIITPESVTDAVRIGADGGAGTTRIFQGRIYSVELRSGLNPAAGSTIWKFDANEYVSGSNFTDVRGRTWTLTNSTAITVARPSNPGDVYVDTNSDFIYNYNGTAWINQGKLGAYTSAANTAPPSSYLTPTVGTISTPDAGALPLQCVFVFKVNGAVSNTETLVAQWFATQRWQIFRSTSNNGLLAIFQDPTNANNSRNIYGGLPGLATDDTFALAVDMSAGTATSLHYDGFVWSTTFVATGAAFTTRSNGTDKVQIGAYNDSLQTQPFSGKIYSVELRTGINPAAGTVLWRFDANDYPGSGASYTDPRGRVWTLTDPAAMTKVSVGSGDVHIDTSTDIVYKYSGTDWAYVGKLGDAANTATAGNTVTGTGYPEGVVTAPIGTRYIDTVATNGAVEWIKGFGTGNTGWRVVNGDTGIRTMTSLITVPTGVTLLAAYLRRINSTVSWKFLWNTTASPGGALTCYNVPVGFRYNDSVSDNNWPYFNTAGTFMGSIGTGAGGATLLMYPVASGVPRYGFEYTTNDNVWPAVLP